MHEVARELLKVSTPKIPRRSGSLEDRILAIFLNPNIRFGPQSFIVNSRAEWLDRIRYFTKRKKRIELTILGFPFKTPVTLKTNRTLPDLGEVLMLQRLHIITNLVGKVYPKGCRLTVFTEGPFAPFAHVTPGEARRYQRSLQYLAKIFSLTDTLRIIDLGSSERRVPGFRKAFTQKCQEFAALHARKERDFMKKYSSAFSSVFHIVNVRNVPEGMVRAAYRAYDGQRPISREANKLLRRLTVQTTRALIQYFAYLRLRDEFRLIPRAVPHALPLTVSPKQGRLGVLPINRATQILPTHGVPVYDTKRKCFSIRYLDDLRWENRSISKIYVSGDAEKLPFYYRVY
ncbi:MAG: L-tyrosine/L-tryptophan isonitrile synthase family protein [bacterium]|nr:L-tyrosine/L-tryptophan isonitrile synthase family protein [bacterium]